MKIGKKKDEFCRYYGLREEYESPLVCPICGDYIHYGFVLRERVAFNEQIQEWCHEWCLTKLEKENSDERMDQCRNATE